MQKALDWIKGICAVPEAGQVYHGKVVSILEFGAFIEILPGKEGLLHVSEIAWTKTDKVEDVLKVGDEVDVKLLEIDPKTGKMRLSMRALTEKPEGWKEPERRGGDRGPRGERGDRGERRGGDRGERRDRGERGERRGGDRGERHGNGGDRHDGQKKQFGQKVNGPKPLAPAAEDLSEPKEEIF